MTLHTEHFDTLIAEITHSDINFKNFATLNNQYLHVNQTNIINARELALMELERASTSIESTPPVMSEYNNLIDQLLGTYEARFYRIAEKLNFLDQYFTLQDIIAYTADFWLIKGIEDDNTLTMFRELNSILNNQYALFK